MMKDSFAFSIILIAVLASRHILQLLVDHMRAPYIQYPVKRGGIAQVYLYNLGTRGLGGYSEYRFKKKNDRWRYVFDKRTWVPFLAFYAVLPIAVLTRSISEGYPSADTWIMLLITWTFASISFFIYYPIRAYALLMRDLRKKKKR